MKTLLITNLYPNCEEPERGIFTAQKVLKLTQHCEIRVVAPISATALVVQMRRSQVPRREEFDGIEVWHPRVWYVPRIGRRASVAMYATAIRPLVARLHERHRFDAIWATWGYPDIVASVHIAQDLGLSVMASLHGSDVNYGFLTPWCKQAIVRALSQCKVVVARSEAMRQILIREGVPQELVVRIYNGVDRTRFFAGDRAEACRQTGLDPNRRRILFVGNLAPVKGLHNLVMAMGQLVTSSVGENVELVLVGDGPERARLQQLAQNLGVESHVRFLGRRSNKELRFYYNSSDIFCLPSLNEGLPNVILEAFACGLPVVATRVGGIPELIENRNLGLLVPPEDSASLGTALREALDHPWDRQEILKHILDFDWDRSVEMTCDLLRYTAGKATKPATLAQRPRPRPVAKRLRALMITRLFPNREETINGRFNLQLGRALHTYCDVEVIAPVPSFPPRRQVPLYEHFDKISVLHPRYFAVPWLNRVIAGRSLLGALKHYRLNADVLLASFAWPDGFAVVRMGQALRIPVIVQVLGSDIDLLPKSGLRRIETIFALHNCQQIYAVSGSLRDRIISLGISPKKITVIHNGVDPALFHPRDRAASRRELGLPEDGRVVLYVGWINQDKGVKYLLEAVASMDTKPILVLAGPDLLKGQMQKYARSLGIAQQCRFAGSQPHEMIGRWMGAADVFALPSLHEGCPNVILEALASGVSVVTTNVGGIPELLSMLNMPWCDMVPPRNVPALAAALERALRAHWTQKEIQVSCSRTWDDVAREVHQLFIKTASFPQ